MTPRNTGTSRASALNTSALAIKWRRTVDANCTTIASVLRSATTVSHASFNMVATVLIWPVRSMGFVLRANGARIVLSLSTVAGSNSAMAMPRSLL